MALFDVPEPEPADPLAGVHSSGSTPETRDRVAFLKTKKVGQSWEEDGRWYVAGKTGVTVFRFR